MMQLIIMASYLLCHLNWSREAFADSRQYLQQQDDKHMQVQGDWLPSLNFATVNYKISYK